jgi:hypothetical protein
LTVDGITYELDVKGAGLVASDENGLKVMPWHRRSYGTPGSVSMRGLHEEDEALDTHRIHAYHERIGTRTYKYIVAFKKNELLVNGMKTRVEDIPKIDDDIAGEETYTLHTNSNPCLEIRAALSMTRIEQIIHWSKKEEWEKIKSACADVLATLKEKGVPELLTFVCEHAGRNLGIKHGLGIVKIFNHAGNTTLAAEDIDDGTDVILYEDTAKDAGIKFEDMYKEYREVTVAKGGFPKSFDQFRTKLFQDDLGYENDMIGLDPSYFGFSIIVGLYAALQDTFPDMVFANAEELKRIFLKSYLSAYQENSKTTGIPPHLKEHLDFRTIRDSL